MKTLELREKSKEELQKLLQENRERLRQLRFDLVSGKVKNVKEIRETKKDIARIQTLLKSKIKEQNNNLKFKVKSEKLKVAIQN
ncbi:50S ribosomal protein L29 [Patescibacteria group bacterium]|nr:50S ribosomal protein L29 [Patescibacteria group bacterium]